MTKKRKPAKRGRPLPKESRRTKRPTRGELSAFTDKKTSVRDRIATLKSLPRSVYNTTDGLEAMMKVLADKEEPINLRLAALESLGAAAFSSAAFAKCHGEYIATLRKVATDEDYELRQRVLGILAREKDGFAQQKLLDGLKNPAKALLSPEKALQLLSYDVHADAYPVAREIVKKSPNPTARREALRLLAADTKSVPMFETILRDRQETSETRQVSAAALHALNPDKLQQHAREIVMDPSESDEMHETSLTALTNFGEPSLAEDKRLLDRVGTLRADRVKESARQFLTKYKR